MKKFKEMVTQSKVKVAAATTALSCSLPMIAHATEAAEGLPPELKTAITSGFNQMSLGATEVIIIAVGASVTIIVLSSGAKYALKMIKGLLAKAA